MSDEYGREAGTARGGSATRGADVGKNTAPVAPLAQWWQSQAEVEIERTVPKAAEYGSTDLVTIGYILAGTMRRQVTDAEAAELGTFFYIIGKLARWQDAVMSGRHVSDDTLFDLGVYVRMVQRIREVGYWG